MLKYYLNDNLEIVSVDVIEEVHSFARFYVDIDNNLFLPSEVYDTYEQCLNEEINLLDDQITHLKSQREKLLALRH